LAGLDGAGFVISNFPATQAVSGSVSVANFPATQAVSVAALPLPAGAASEAKLEAIRLAVGSPLQAGGTVAVGNFPATQVVSGSVAVSNFPATQAISAAALPLPAGAATAAGQVSAQTSLSAIAASLPGALGAKAGGASTSVVVASDLANLEPGGAAITGQAMPAGGVGLTGWMSAIYKACAAPLVAGAAHIGGVSVDDVADGATTSGSATSAAVVVSASMAGYAGGSFQVTSIGTGNTVIFEQSNDGVTWYFLFVQQGGQALAPSVGASGVNTVGFYNFVSASSFVRARVSVYGSGTVAVTLVQKRSVAPVAGISLAQGYQYIGSIDGSVNKAVGYTDSTTALGAAATFTGATRPWSLGSSHVSFFNGQSQADQAGTLFIEASYDGGTTYYPVASVAASAMANAAGVTSYSAQARVPVTGAVNSNTAYRVVYKNGATAQGAFRLTSSFTAG